MDEYFGSSGERRESKKCPTKEIFRLPRRSTTGFTVCSTRRNGDIAMLIPPLIFLFALLLLLGTRLLLRVNPDRTVRAGRRIPAMPSRRDLTTFVCDIVVIAISPTPCDALRRRKISGALLCRVSKSRGERTPIISRYTAFGAPTDDFVPPCAEYFRE